MIYRLNPRAFENWCVARGQRSEFGRFLTSIPSSGPGVVVGLLSLIVRVPTPRYGTVVAEAAVRPTGNGTMADTVVGPTGSGTMAVEVATVAEVTQAGSGAVKSTGSRHPETRPAPFSDASSTYKRKHPCACHRQIIFDIVSQIPSFACQRSYSRQ